MKSLVVMLVVAVGFGVPLRLAHAMPPGVDGDLVRSAEVALDELHISDAKSMIDRVAPRWPNDPDVAFVRAEVEFYRGDYALAVTEMARARTLRDDAAAREFEMVVKAAAEVTQGFRKVISSDGRFSISYADGPDAVLVPYALEVLAKQLRALEAEFGTRIVEPVRLEIYGETSDLARVSTLTKEDIERTGTIALCKWGRLMVTSPRALLRGYPWLDTVAHELVHLVVSVLTRDHTPVWLQEGLAKYYESRWRTERDWFVIEPGAAGILRNALANDSLLPFESLHPSIARLPSQNDAALAFAQVSTFVANYHKHHGAVSLREGLSRVRSGQDAAESMAAGANTTFSELQNSWRRTLERDFVEEAQTSKVLPLVFADGRNDTRPVAGRGSEPPQIEDEVARKFVRLGDLLWDRGRKLAASVEYGKAFARSPENFIVATRYARASLEAGRADAAIAAADLILKKFPHYAPAHAVRGAALQSANRMTEARLAYREAIGINPFDPDPHCALSAIADARVERQTEETACALLRPQRAQ